MANEHLLRLGKLLGNLQSLECLLRAYLLGVEQRATGTAPSGLDYWNLRPGDQVAENAFTNYDALGALISKYNADVGPRDQSLAIESGIVDVRDLLAHGRVASRTPDLAEMAIVKFDRPVGGHVTVVACARMTDSWFDSNIKLTHDLIMKVHSAYERFAV